MTTYCVSEHFEAFMFIRRRKTFGHVRNFYEFFLSASLIVMFNAHYTNYAYKPRSLPVKHLQSISQIYEIHEIINFNGNPNTILGLKFSQMLIK